MDISTFTGEVGATIIGLDMVGITITIDIDGTIMVDQDMTVIVITLVGIGDLIKVGVQDLDLSEDMIKVGDPDRIEDLDLSEDPIKVGDPDRIEDLIKVKRVIIAINDKL